MFNLIAIDIFSPYMLIIEASVILVYSFFCGILAKKNQHSISFNAHTWRNFSCAGTENL